ncbi:MAG TPA: hypothetical protein VKB53_09085 [Gammaproteobacteria bacterium]|jgi:hypothetical protein|nr:hypothetical protein [Gammaproteobacteria bacterium]
MLRYHVDDPSWNPVQEAGDAVLFDETRWWEDLICDAVLLTEIADTFSRYLVLPSTG